ncbi:autotransporter domain-containing protein (plasmid) [Photobacterium sp. DA100]|uniref:autotransporter domain-containing protein n=1 Tax=Photobacterium sp. DA100 TaxID=3027472 RepID=UPI002479E0D1|nr:autotransporter domain-containing protein [Photobacterium sp. DA100]WEM45361.1 autotransporter domain-containing protein [Photobacterium sp. DA100]
MNHGFSPKAAMLACLLISSASMASDRNQSIDAGVTFIGDMEMATLGYSKTLAHNIVTSAGFMIGNDEYDFNLPEGMSDDQDAWGLYTSVGYKIEIAEFDIIPKISLNYLNADVNFKDESGSEFSALNIDNVYGSIGGTVNWRMVGITVDYGKIQESNVMLPGQSEPNDIEEDVVRVMASFNF